MYVSMYVQNILMTDAFIYLSIYLFICVIEEENIFRIDVYFYERKNIRGRTTYTWLVGSFDD